MTLKALNKWMKCSYIFDLLTINIFSSSSAAGFESLTGCSLPIPGLDSAQTDSTNPPHPSPMCRLPDTPQSTRVLRSLRRMQPLALAVSLPPPSLICLMHLPHPQPPNPTRRGPVLRWGPSEKMTRSFHIILVTWEGMCWFTLRRKVA